MQKFYVRVLFCSGKRIVRGFFFVAIIDVYNEQDG